MSSVPNLAPFTLADMARDMDALEACRDEAEIAAWQDRMNSRPQDAGMKAIIADALAIKRATPRP
jgi:hypothetical protein